MASLLGVAKQDPDFIVPLATVNPADPDAVVLLEDAVRHGARGLKLMSGHPDYYQAPLDAPPMLAVFEVARELGIPVLIHVSPKRISPRRRACWTPIRTSSWTSAWAGACHATRPRSRATCGRTAISSSRTRTGCCGVPT